MAIFKKKQFEELAKERGNYCISIYIPTKRHGENKESKIHLKNKIAIASKSLEELGMKPKEIDEYLKPITGVHQNQNLWRHLSDALVIFRSKNKFEYYTLPVKVEDFVLISERFYLLPLIELFNQDRIFYVLSISQKKNRLFEATPHEIAEMDVDDLFPETIYDTVGHDVEQKSLQMRGEQTGTGHHNPNKAGAMYHGKGEGKDDKNKEIIRYLEELDNGLNDLLNDSSAPVVVVSVDEIFGHFKSISNYKNLFPKNVSGNFDDEDMPGLHERALAILTPYLEQVRNEKKVKFNEVKGKSSTSIEDIVVSADAGKVETLFISKGEKIWGEYEEDSAKIKIHHERQKVDNCLLELAARKTFLKNGEVFLENQEDLPGNEAPANAIFRY